MTRETTVYAPEIHGAEVDGRMSDERYFEDLAAGQTFHSGTFTLDADAIKRFAAAFDPQPFHLDEAAAERSFFGGLAASGWHTAAITARLLSMSNLRIAGGIVGAGIDELRWHTPVRPGDTLRVEIEILDARPSRTRPDHGLVKLRTTTLNQESAVVLVSLGTLVVPRRRRGPGPVTP